MEIKSDTLIQSTKRKDYKKMGFKTVLRNSNFYIDDSALL